MFSYRGVREQLIAERQKNARMQSEVEKTNADIAYIAMMTDVDLDADAQEGTGDEIE